MHVSCSYLSSAPSPSFSGRRCSCLERNTTPRHVCAVPASFWQSSEDSPFPPFLARLSVVPVKWLVSLSDTLIAVVTYLLTAARSVWRMALDRIRRHAVTTFNSRTAAKLSSSKMPISAVSCVDLWSFVSRSKFKQRRRYLKCGDVRLLPISFWL